MSELTRLIKHLHKSGNQVDTQEYLKKKAVDDVVSDSHSHDSKKYVWGQPLEGDFKDVVIGGYDNANDAYGVGPTRVLSIAAYCLKLFVVEQDVQLKGFFGSAPKLNNFLEELRHHSNFTHTRHSARISELNDHITLPSGYIEKVNISFDGIITNVHKTGSFSYNGDLALQIKKNLGYDISSLTSAEQKDYYSIRTIDLLSGQSSTNSAFSGAAFRKQLSDSMRQMSSFSNNFMSSKKSENNYHKLWVLAVE